MGTTSLFAASFLFAPLQQLARWINRQADRAQGLDSHTALPRPAVARNCAAVHRAAPPHAARTARLRVVRVFDGSPAAAGAGRMVISGRMADVCAELERLAALEAAAG